MKPSFEKIVVALLVLLAMRLTKDNRTGHEQEIIDSGVKFLGKQ
jgi:hypothetical protein